MESKRILFSVLRQDSDKRKIDEEIKHFAQQDWDSVYRFALQSKLWPAFYTRLIELKLNNIPYDFLLKFKDLYITNLKRNLLFEQESLKIIGYLEKEGISGIPLKGPIWARYLYGDLGLRIAPVDLDILVRYEDIKRSEDKLFEIGYRTFLSNKELNYTHRFFNEIMFYKLEDAKRIYLELHWEMFKRPFHLNLKEFWQNSRKISLDRYSVIMPSLEDMILYLSFCVILNPGPSRIKYLYDLNKLLTNFKDKIDWDKIFLTLEEIKRPRDILLSIRLCKEIFFTDVPEKYLLGIRPQGFKNFLYRRYFDRKKVLRSIETKDALYLKDILVWNKILGGYIYANNIFEFLKIMFRKIFISMEEVNLILGIKIDKISVFAYLKRLSKLINIFLQGLLGSKY